MAGQPYRANADTVAEGLAVRPRLLARDALLWLELLSRSSRRRPWPMPDALGSDGMRERSFIRTRRKKVSSGVNDSKKDPAEAGPFSMQCTLTYWMRVRQYGHTFQSALSGRWHVGQTFLTCVLQMGHTTKSRSMGAPHLGQMP